VLGQPVGAAGIEDLHVDAVRDAREAVAPRAEDAREPVRVVRIVQLGGVGRRDRADPVGRDEGGLHEVRAVVEAQRLVALGGQAQHVVVELQVGLALILDIVDGEHRFDAAEVGAELGLHEKRHQRGLPVVAVDDIGLEADILHGGEDGLAEIGVALPVVGEAVDAAAAEVVLVVDEIDLQLALLCLEVDDADVLPPPGERHVEVAQKFHVPRGIVLDGGVVRQKQAHLVAGDGGQRLGQRLHHVAEAAGLDERRGLGGDHRNFHMMAPLLMTRG